ncbi:MAG TPA: S1-like domain-containing RNA-binding protein [Bdellovibrio sp.]|uniref:CvfB family protein n=1 Tax=Bdellovibrio sp. TaxID=28201 RepID=UPI002EEA5F1C
MLEVGKVNKLKIVKQSEYGLFLDGENEGEILLPRRYVPENYTVGDELEVFVYVDSEDRLVATTERPLATVGEFASLKVVSLSPVGAFLDWGLPKDLFMPFSERTEALRVGQLALVYIYLDKSGRISASMRVNRYIDKEPGEYEEGQSVDLIIANKSNLGFNAIINGRHLGVLYSNEVFQPLKSGQRVEGYIKKIRPDGKIDLALHKTGYAGTPELSDKILAVLKEEGGYLEINDKTSAELIHQYFGVSKKKYKMALGGLYKKRLITVSDDGIRLVGNKKTRLLGDD